MLSRIFWILIVIEILKILIYFFLCVCFFNVFMCVCVDFECYIFCCFVLFVFDNCCCGVCVV